MVAYVAPDVREKLLRLLVALSEENGSQVSDVLQRLGHPLENFDAGQLTRRVSSIVMRVSDDTAGSLQAGSLLGELMRISVECGLRPPAELALLGKTLLNLDAVARRLDSDFQPNSTIAGHVTALMQRRMRESASPGHLLAAALEATEFAERLPNRLNKVLDALAEGRFTFNVEGIDESELMRGFQKLANRLATGAVVAACLLSGAIFANSHVGPKLFSYPAMTVILLLVGALGTMWLIVGMRRSDLPQRRLRKNGRQRSRAPVT
jgi:predicted unusual protein kinase regulating ubiquinone biosynthesis (AarF/ABC1/UbiB family)